MMMNMDIPEQLAQELSPIKAELPHILELGLREYRSERLTGFQGMSEILDFLAGLPSAEEVLQLRPSTALQTRIQELLEKNRTAGLSEIEAQEWAQYEHLVRIAKAKAQLKRQAKHL